MAGFPFIDLEKQNRALGAPLEEAILSVTRKAKYINGPEVKELEKALADYVGVPEAVACASGTDALILPLMVWDLKQGEAVFCPTFTFIATAEVVALRGATPVFVDVDPVTYNIDVKDLSAKIEKVKSEGRLVPKAIIPVDLFGLPADYEAIEHLAKKHNLLVLEDSAQGFGGIFKGKRSGSFGDVAGTSFFPAKPLGCFGDGGAIFTHDASLAEVVRSLRSHGQGSHKYEHVRLGQNSRLDTLQAAVLLVKLRAFPEELEARQKVAGIYMKLLADLPLVTVPTVPEAYLSSWAQFTIRVPADRREKIISDMASRGIPTMVYYPRCLHLQPAFASYGGKVGDCPVAEKASLEVLSLPMHPYLEPDEQKQVIGALKDSLSQG